MKAKKLLQKLHIPGTNRTPDTYFSPDGAIKIKGRAFRTDGDKVSKELWIWLDSYIEEPAQETVVVLAFEYINTVSTTVLMKILKILMNVLPSKKLVINWYYEQDDYDMLDRGEFISNTLNYPVNFIETGNIHEV